MRRLESPAELEAVLKDPGTVLLLKHSTRCSISAQALEEVQAFTSDFVLLDLLAHRDLSKAIADRLSVPHESPQAILLKGGRVAAVLNHFDIDRAALSRLLP
jgi:bacillithiol system protein YtxJ